MTGGLKRASATHYVFMRAEDRSKAQVISSNND